MILWLGLNEAKPRFNPLDTALQGGPSGAKQRHNLPLASQIVLWFREVHHSARRWAEDVQKRNCRSLAHFRSYRL